MHQSWNTPLADYCSQNSSPGPLYLKELVAYTWKQTVNPRMLSGHLQGRFLAMVSSLMKPTTVVEIGTFTGYSALCLAEGLAPNGKLITVEANAEYAHKAKAFIDKTPMANRIEVVNQQGLDFITELKNESVDMVFVDADKLSYRNYYTAIKDKIRSSGLLIFDNVLWSEKVIDENALKTDRDTREMNEFNEFMKIQPDYEALLLPMRDGLGLYRRK